MRILTHVHQERFESDMGAHCPSTRPSCSRSEGGAATQPFPLPSLIFHLPSCLLRLPVITIATATATAPSPITSAPGKQGGEVFPEAGQSFIQSPCRQGGIANTQHTAHSTHRTNRTNKSPTRDKKRGISDKHNYVYTK